eukprot:gb/GEZN01004123.1/.p1 GENE.gb/GEZN01004123.1/~~gb/GEZN01004123.1/.p1  ORF type:complete len:610 (+),score=96.59 gb/GEZN01004123.1/:204-1832(+)
MGLEAVFVRSGLDERTVQKIVKLADPYQRRVFDKKAIYVLLRLIVLAQAKEPVSYPSLNINTKLGLPQIQGLDLATLSMEEKRPPAHAPVITPVLSRAGSLAQEKAVMPADYKATPPPFGRMLSLKVMHSEDVNHPGGLPPLPMPLGGPIGDYSHGHSTPRSLGGLGLLEDGLEDDPLSMGPPMAQAPKTISGLPDGMQPMVFSDEPYLPRIPGLPNLPLLSKIKWPPPPPPLGEIDAMWLMTEDEFKKYKILFAKYVGKGEHMEGPAARDVLLKSKVAPETLKQIWVLSDLDNDGRLNENEFAIAMHLTVGVAKKLLLVPPELPSILNPDIAHPQNPMTEMLLAFGNDRDPEKELLLKKQEQHRLHRLWLAETALNDPSAHQRLQNGIEQEKRKLQETKQMFTEKLAQIRQASAETQKNLDQADMELKQAEISLAEIESTSKEHQHQQEEAEEKTKTLKKATLEAEEQVNKCREEISNIKIEIRRIELDDELVQEEMEQSVLSFKDMEDLLSGQKENLKIRISRLPDHTKAQLRTLGYRGP